MKKLLDKIKKYSLATQILTGFFLFFIIILIVSGLDNVIGLMAGIIAAMICLIEITRRWRHAWSFLLLAIGTILGAILISGIHVEIIYRLAVYLGGETFLDSLAWHIYSAVIKYGLLFIGPAGIVVGLGGAAVKSILALRNRLGKDPSSDTILPEEDNKPLTHEAK